MQSLSDNERREVLGEVLHDELQAIFELVKGVPAIRQELHQVQADIADLKQDMRVVKAAVTDLSKEHRDFDRRLSQLEST
jgi:septal ring factor EnvC (AmiA/AmiB activator)